MDISTEHYKPVDVLNEFGGSLPDHLVDGLLQDVYTEDVEMWMKTVCDQLHLPKTIRRSPWRKATFMDRIVDPKVNPFWILLGYDAGRQRWKGGPSKYNLEGSAGVKDMAQKAKDLLIEIDGMRVQFSCPTNQVRWTGLRKFLEVLTGEEVPIMSCIGWAYVSDKDFFATTTEDAHTGRTQLWSIPHMTTMDEFVDVCHDGIKAIWNLLVEARLVEREIAAPCHNVFALCTVEDKAARNKKTILAFLESSNITGMVSAGRKVEGASLFIDKEFSNIDVRVVTGESAMSILAMDPRALVAYDPVDPNAHKGNFYTQAGCFFFDVLPRDKSEKR